MISQPSQAVLSVGIAPGYDYKAAYSHFDALQERARGSQPALRASRPDDLLLMGMGEILSVVGNDLTQRSFNMLLRGKSSDGSRYITLDLELDEQLHADVEVTLDIDSILWTTTMPRVKSTCDVNMVPTIASKPPIAKHNHAYVSLLAPPKEVDLGNKQRDWIAFSTSQSNVPHTRFASVGSFTFIICFPRMFHKDEFSGKRQNIVPIQILDLFWDKIVLEALRQVASDSKLVYLSWTVDQWRAKTAGSGSMFTGYSKTLGADDFNELIKAMAKVMRLNANDPVLDRFGSYYFVVEAKGVKLVTQVDLGSEMSPVEKMRERWPELDWDYMFDRRNGELLLDLGIAFNPVCDNESSSDHHSSGDGGEPLVGLWRLDALIPSYLSAGYKQPNIHKLNYLEHYGGLNGEMAAERSRLLGTNFRNTYCMVYEPSRMKDNQPRFCSDADAYECSPAWRKAVKDKLAVYSDAALKSYGVRDEYRCSGVVLLEILKKMPELVRIPNSASHNHITLLNVFFY